MMIRLWLSVSIGHTLGQQLEHMQTLAEEAYWQSRDFVLETGTWPGKSTKTAFTGWRGAPWPCFFGEEHLHVPGTYEVGYRTCGLRQLVPPCIVYSFGSGGDFGFEDMVHKFAPACKIFVFDADPLSISSDTLVTQQEHTGLKGENGMWPVQLLALTNRSGLLKVQCRPHQKPVTVMTKTLRQIMARHGHNHIDILKIDIEGHEHAVVQHLAMTGWPSIGQLLIEVHIGPDYPPRTHSSFDPLVNQVESAGFRLFYAEHNIFWGRNCCLVFSFIQRFWQPAVKDFPLLHHKQAAGYRARLVRSFWAASKSGYEIEGQPWHLITGPLTVYSGAAFSIVWQILNVGTIDWLADSCDIHLVSGDSWGANLALHVPPADVLVNDTATLRLVFIAPNRTGFEEATWSLRQPVTYFPFGHPMVVQIHII